MSAHRADGLEIFGGMPEIEKLYGGRFRLTFRCDTPNNTESWYYDNKDNLLTDFGTLMDAGFGNSPETPDPDSTWPDQRLVEHGLEYLQGKDTPIVKFVYETLTDTWEKEDEDKPSSTENGLRLLTRQVVSAPGTAAPYDEDDVGVETITSAGKTLYLAGFQDDSDDRIGRFITRWAEAGILSVRTPKVGGQQTVVVSALGMTEAAVTSALSEVTPSHKLIDVSKGNYEGFRTLNYTFEVDNFDVLSSTENGLKQITRTQLSTSNFTRGDVGADLYETLYLAGEEIDNGNTIKKRVSKWAEAGLLDVTDSAGPSSMPGSRRYTYTSQGLPFYPDVTLDPVSTGTAIGDARGKLEANRDGNYNGFKRYVRTWLVQKNGTTLTGIKYTGFDVVNVQVPGTVELITKQVSSGGESGTIALALETPRRSRRVDAQMTMRIVTEPPEAVALAYDLGNISCSVMFTQASLRVGPGATATAVSGNTSQSVTGFVKSFGVSARSRPYEGCYLVGDNTDEVTGTVSYVAVSTPVVNGNIITSDETTSSVVTKAIGTGSKSAEGYTETGILRQKPRAILTTEDGTTYYEVVTWETI